MNKPIFHFSNRAYDDELSEGLHLAGYDVSDRETGRGFLHFPHLLRQPLKSL